MTRILAMLARWHHAREARVSYKRWVAGIAAENARARKEARK